MTITSTRSKYYVLTVLGALVLAVGVLAVAPSASQAQQTDPITVDKECSPNPVQVGQPLTCTIDVEPAFVGTSEDVVVTDTLPAGVTVTGATQQQFEAGVLIQTEPCAVTGNTVTCPSRLVRGPIFDRTLRVTIDAIAQECGTFTNTAEASALDTSVTVTDAEEITVEGCEEEAGGGGAGGGGGAPITQEGEQESESGEIDQTFDVS